MSQQLDGLIVKEQSGFYWVEATDGIVYVCRLRGRLKEDAKTSDIAAIGDRVSITLINADGHEGIIEAVYERHTVLSRAVRTTGKRGGGQAEREQVLIANPDQAFFVFAAAQPTPNLQLLDRLLVTGEAAEIDEVVIVINKIDLENPSNINELLQPYRRMGYDMIFTSAVRDDGLDDLKARLKDKISVFTGPSGVGKTSLLNKVQAGLGRSVKSISEFSQEGIHTTRDSALIKLETGGYLADTPGIRTMAVWDVEPDELDAYFVDIWKYAPTCKFRNCTHTNEPGCAVIAATESGAISRRRYDHFLKLREELRETYIVY
ncbi:MAG: ribosome small subunit-dependent GTPase A [Anaerolineae bacterium]|nr:ribosome small subunit-dependent GTPase A [Anaerolineae bacterium]MDQ7036259.1 ribosome small subunit-dependent GTPase A [Anaerolineae bacterium]